jgi:hypothetical protein
MRCFDYPAAYAPKHVCEKFGWQVATVTPSVNGTSRARYITESSGPSTADSVGAR